MVEQKQSVKLKIAIQFNKIVKELNKMLIIYKFSIIIFLNLEKNKVKIIRRNLS